MRGIITKSNNKTRDLSVLQLFEVLQQEYVVCEIRSKIYPTSVINKQGITINPRSYWKSLMDKKKEKILDIAYRNSLPTIFDDKRIKQDFEKKIIPDIGFPKFLYKDSQQQLIQEKWDLHNYYTKGSEIKAMNEVGDLLFGFIVEVNFNERIVLMQIKDSETKQQFSFDLIARIL